VWTQGGAIPKYGGGGIKRGEKDNWGKRGLESERGKGYGLTLGGREEQMTHKKAHQEEGRKEGSLAVGWKEKKKKDANRSKKIPLERGGGREWF